MPSNELHHDKTLAALNTEAKYAKCSRRWTRFGHNGETSGGAYARDARKAYNKAHRKASRLQLSRYQAPSEEPTQQELDYEYYIWGDLRTQADMWYEEKLRNNEYYR